MKSALPSLLSLPSSQPGLIRKIQQLVLAGSPMASGVVGPAVAGAEWPDIVKVAEEQGLAPLLYKSLQKVGRLDGLPSASVTNLRAAYLDSSVANWLAVEQLSGLLDALERERIPVILLKGCALGPTIYGDAALRPMTDLDLLVRQSDASRAWAMLVERGFLPRLDLDDGFSLRFSNEQAFERNAAPRLRVDLHTHLLGNPYFSLRMDIEWFWQQSFAVSLNERTARIFSPEAQLLHSSAHLTFHHGRPRLIWSYDLALLLTVKGEEIDWDDLLGVAGRFGLALALKEGLARAAEDWGVRVSPTVTSHLAAVMPGRVEKFLRRGLILPHSQVTLISVALSGLRLSEKVRYFWRQVFPEPSYMRQRYQLRRSSLLPAYYFCRLALGVFRGLAFTAAVLHKK